MPLPTTSTPTATAVAPAELDTPTDVAIRPDPALIARLKGELQLSDSTRIATFGGEAQREVASFADAILRDTANRDSGPIGELITSMILSVNKLDPDSLRNASFLQRLFGGIKGKVIRFREEFQSLASQVDRISLELERNQDVLKRDVAMLDGLFNKSLNQLRFLEAYIVAGSERLDEEKRTRLVALEQQAAGTDGAAGQLAAQKLNDFRQALDRLERRLHDLKLSRVMALQTLPQIRLIQNGNVALVEKLQSSLTQTIPAWKQQMTVALALHNQSEALELQRKVSDTTNEILRKNAEQLRTGTIGIEREVQRGIVDIETLAQVQRDFAATLNEVLAIQQEGRAKRLAAEQEMLRIEHELKATLTQAQPQAPARG
ncbi:MAG: toxic anion resistance protein [Xanthobacteraceae bacterium]